MKALVNISARRPFSERAPVVNMKPWPPGVSLPKVFQHDCLLTRALKGIMESSMRR